MPRAVELRVKGKPDYLRVAARVSGAMLTRL